MDGRFRVGISGGGTCFLFLDMVPDDGTNQMASAGILPGGQTCLVVAKFGNYLNGSVAANTSATTVDLGGLTSAGGSVSITDNSSATPRSTAA